MSANNDQLVAEAKRKASYAAINEHVTADTKVIGIGSGSTVVFCVERLAQRMKSESLSLQACIPTSFQAKQLIIEAGLPLSELNQHPTIDVAFDGADEVDTSLNCIKGGGACQLQEKLVASCAKKFVIVADYRKDSTVLGQQWKNGVPLEVIPMAYVSILEVAYGTIHPPHYLLFPNGAPSPTYHYTFFSTHFQKLKALGGKPTLRMATRKAGPVVTDNGNFVIDADFGNIKDPVALEKDLISIPGIVETGLFCNMATWAYFGMDNGEVKTRKL
ncbi:ribose-5-phosphate isomerase [Powellomyces hirtus]|uniref:Ribose-5-phosphate isomerase n=1 Tax=Powellomyces hirtus TaxID=109895 RepID=A0A507E302_9FUNG|nr:ribose-5-phosphate isomerase [Powellomyces hirtus]